MPELWDEPTHGIQPDGLELWSKCEPNGGLTGKNHKARSPSVGSKPKTFSANPATGTGSRPRILVQAARRPWLAEITSTRFLDKGKSTHVLPA
jgi:hypothetical protein